MWPVSSKSWFAFCSFLDQQEVLRNEFCSEQRHLEKPSRKSVITLQQNNNHEHLAENVDHCEAALAQMFSRKPRHAVLEFPAPDFRSVCRWHVPRQIGHKHMGIISIT